MSFLPCPCGCGGLVCTTVETTHASTCPAVQLGTPPKAKRTARHRTRPAARWQAGPGVTRPPKASPNTPPPTA